MLKEGARFCNSAAAVVPCHNHICFDACKHLAILLMTVCYCRANIMIIVFSIFELGKYPLCT